MQAILSALYRYPLKSGQAQPLLRSQIGPQGIPQDREWMVATPDGQYITGRTHPQLLLIKATPNEDGVHFSAPGMNNFFVSLAAFQLSQKAEIWDDHFPARSGASELNAWFSAYLNQTVIVMWIGLESHRPVKLRPEVATTFTDGFPLLLIGEGSLAELNRRAGKTFESLRFRPNLVIRNTDAFAEDQWKQIKIGDVIFDLVKPCERCVMTTLDPETAEKSADQEPLRTLAKFRKFDDGVYFGQNVIARGFGIIHTGMPVTVIA